MSLGSVETGNENICRLIRSAFKKKSRVFRREK
jgi:hypothetical protein